ncbi:MAG: MTAP family purine nucleoside phosphorylase [Deltaproteobacteria bacterium]|nr:MTAP family purine nucleoside phosphorylase [Deltaproteobacteria bacterium]MBW2142526.1 MTAP family purine nucleoside phosphorylase [Deltaproteobacteria bacterium]
MPKRIGLIGGTVFYHKDFFEKAEKKIIETNFGPALVALTEQIAYVPRHGIDGGKYILPHKINYQANLAVLKTLDVEEVIGVNSTGSLKMSLAPGTVVLPHDYICLTGIPTTAEDESLHIIPMLSEEVRSKLEKAATAAEVKLIDRAIYWETPGPRLETRAEISLIANFADLVGMTMASEATIAQELKIDYASLCSVDNYAHGLSETPLSEGEIRASAAANAEKIFSIIKAYLNL